MELQSIRPGATITVLDVDTEKGCLLLKTKQGQTRSRPLSELQTIWNELNQKPAVHVEGVLHGSGTSRNQPETILANLPYIEWLKLNNKKHIAFVGKNTHPFGTLKQMSPLDSVGISTLDSKGTNAIKVKTVIVTDNVLDSCGYRDEYLRLRKANTDTSRFEVRDCGHKPFDSAVMGII